MGRRAQKGKSRMRPSRRGPAISSRLRLCERNPWRDRHRSAMHPRQSRAHRGMTAPPYRRAPSDLSGWSRVVRKTMLLPESTAENRCGASTKAPSKAPLRTRALAKPYARTPTARRSLSAGASFAENTKAPAHQGSVRKPFRHRPARCAAQPIKPVSSAVTTKRGISWTREESRPISE